MRNFVDPWAIILDDRGKLLKGRITFYEANTTEKKSIYATDGVTVLPNPIYTDAFGKTMNQVLLEDSDYTIKFERYIGAGNMETDPSEDAWFDYKTVLSKNGDFTNIISGSNIVSVSSVADLKSISSMQDGDVVQLIGYFNAGDSGEPRLYIWHDSGQVTDDGGVTIKSSSTNTGYWRMVIPGTYIDVRWYGDLPDSTANPSSPTSNLGQRAKAAQAANIYRKDLYFPCSTKNTNGYYLFDGSNTVSVNKDIICDNGVRFVVRNGTVGTAIICHELHKCERYLFVSESNQLQIGQYSLTADWIKASWLKGWLNAAGAREGYILDEMNQPLYFSNTKIKIENSPASGTQFDNCQILEAHKIISNQCTMQNMLVKTEWFTDDYDWADLNLAGCTILLENCKDANTYIRLKNKQNESDYGDLGEQSINAQVRAGGTIENCYGTVTFISHGNTEMHNVSLTVNGLNSSDSLNLVDSWITFGSDTVLSSLQLRRGSLAGNSLRLLGASLIDGADTTVPINSLGADLTIRNSSIHGYITAGNLTLINNQIYIEVNQVDVNGVVNVNCVSNMFHLNSLNLPARHYVHANTPDSIVKGIWSKNGSSYDTIHWIRLDRSNLKYQDSDHQYTYTGNSEPFLMKWSGRNHPMVFYTFGGHWTRSQQGTGIFSTYDKPFVFYNDRERFVSVVPRQNYWKMFTVGRGYLMRSAHIHAATVKTIGIIENDYVEHRNGMVVPTWTWGCQRYSNQQMLGGHIFCSTPAVSRDDGGEANFDVSFEGALATHGEFSYGQILGYYPSDDFDSGKWVNSYPVYPATPGTITLCVMVDPDFSTVNNPQELTTT